MSEIKEKLIKRTMTSAINLQYAPLDRDIAKLRTLFLEVEKKRESLDNSEENLYNSRTTILESMISIIAAVHSLEVVEEIISDSGNIISVSDLLSHNNELKLLLANVKDEIENVIVSKTEDDSKLKEISNSLQALFTLFKNITSIPDDIGFNIDLSLNRAGYYNFEKKEFVDSILKILSFVNDDEISVDLTKNGNDFSSCIIKFNKSYFYEDGTVDYPFIIRSIDDFSKFKINSTIGTNYRLGNNIYLEDFKLDNQIAFIGTLDGNGYKITSNVFPFNSISGQVKNIFFKIGNDVEIAFPEIADASIFSSSVIENCAFIGDHQIKILFNIASGASIEIKSNYFSNVVLNISGGNVITDSKNINKYSKSSTVSIDNSEQVDDNFTKKIYSLSDNIFYIKSGTVVKYVDLSELELTFKDDKLRINFDYIVDELSNKRINLSFTLNSKKNSGIDFNKLSALDTITYYIGYLTTLSRIHSICDDDKSLFKKIELVDYEGAITAIINAIPQAYLEIQSSISSKFNNITNQVVGYLNFENIRKSDDPFYIGDYTEELIVDMANIYNTIMDNEKNEAEKYSDILFAKEKITSTSRLLLDDCFQSFKILESYIREINPIIHTDSRDISVILDQITLFNNNHSINIFTNAMPFNPWKTRAFQVLADNGYILGIMYVVHELGVQSIRDAQIRSILKSMSNYIINKHIESSSLDLEVFNIKFKENVESLENFRSRTGIDIDEDFIFELINPSLSILHPEFEIINQLDFFPYIDMTTDFTYKSDQLKKIENIILMVFYKVLNSNGTIDRNVLSQILNIYNGNFLGLKDLICRDLLYSFLVAIKFDDINNLKYLILDSSIINKYRQLYTFFINNEKGFLLSYIDPNRDALNELCETFFHVSPVEVNPISINTVINELNNTLKRNDDIVLKKRGDVND